MRFEEGLHAFLIQLAAFIVRKQTMSIINNYIRGGESFVFKVKEDMFPIVRIPMQGFKNYF